MNERRDSITYARFIQREQRNEISIIASRYYKHTSCSLSFFLDFFLSFLLPILLSSQLRTRASAAYMCRCVYIDVFLDIANFAICTFQRYAATHAFSKNAYMHLKSIHRFATSTNCGHSHHSRLVC